MPERDHPTLSESFEPEEQPIAPPFPFAVHIPREGEPPFEARLSFFDPKSSTLQGQKMRIIWTQWALKQPDRALFALENELSNMWFITKGQLPDEYVERHEQDKVKYLHLLRDQGHGDLIDTYWPHLLPNSPEE